MIAAVVAAVVVVALVGIALAVFVPWSHYGTHRAPVRLADVPIDAKGQNPAGVPCPNRVVTVFFKPETPDALVKDTAARLAASPGVQRAVFVSKHDAFLEYSVMYKDQPPAELGPDEVPPSERMVVDGAATQLRIEAAAQGLPEVRDVVTRTAGESPNGPTYYDVDALVIRPGVPGAPCR
jgi:hypothetical protein